MLDTIYSLLAFGAMALASHTLGRPILGGLGMKEDDRLTTVVWSLGVGLIAGGTLILLMGLLGILYASVVGVLSVGACGWGIGQILRPYVGASRCSLLFDGNKAQQRADDPSGSPCRPPTRWLTWVMLLGAGVACLGSLVGALAPPTAGDALCYHLELPKEFLAEHCIMYLPYSDNSTFPLLTEMWYVWGLALEGAVCAQLVHWGLGVLLALASVVLATEILGRRWAWIVGSVVLLTPGINNQMTAPMNDVALAVMTTLAVAAWWRAVVNDEGRHWFVFAGLAVGGALGTKYVAAILVVAVGVNWAWILWRQPQRRRFLLEGAAVVAVIGISIAGPWYARAAWYRGNPVYPFFNEVLVRGEVPAEESTEEGLLPRTLPASKSPLKRRPLDLALAPWHVTMHPEKFGGRGHQLGILFLAVIPGTLFTRRLRGMGTLTTIALAYGVVWFLLRQNVRFLFPIVPLLSILAVWVWVEMRRFRSPSRFTAGGMIACLVAAMVLVPLVRCQDQWAVAIGAEEREDYLIRHEPTYPAAAVANAMLRADAHILSQDYRAFYFNHRVTRESVYRREEGYDQELASPAELGRHLRRQGFTHLLLAENVSGGGIEFDPTLSRLADAQIAHDATADDDHALLPLTEYHYIDAEGAERRYRLMAIADP